MLTLFYNSTASHTQNQNQQQQQIGKNTKSKNVPRLNSGAMVSLS